jgi:hypothetical protein
MSQPPLDELYFTWLYSKVGSVNIADPSRTYWKLLKQFFKKEFVWFVPNDDNRVEDGRDLRKEFVQEEGVSVEDDWLRLGCSMFELLVALSRRLEFEGGGYAKDWFWTMIRNLGMEFCTDAIPFHDETIDEALDDVIWRTYRYSGVGGLFPLQHPDRDQREVEIWYQLCAYLLEHGY